MSRRHPSTMIGRAWWDDLTVAVMRCSTTKLWKLSWRWSAILWKLSWRRWSTISHWLVVRRITRVGNCHRLLLLRVSSGSSISHVGVVRTTIILRRVLIVGIASSVARQTILSYWRMVVLMVTPLRISHNWWKPEVLMNLIKVGFSLYVR